MKYKFLYVGIIGLAITGVAQKGSPAPYFRCTDCSPNPDDYYYPPPDVCITIWGVTCSTNPASGYWPPTANWASCHNLALGIYNLQQQLTAKTKATCGSDQTCINEQNSIEGGCTQSPYTPANCSGIIGQMKETLQTLCTADPNS